MDRSKVLEKVRGLLNKAGDSAVVGTPEEEALRDKADQLMNSYAIAEWEALQAGDTDIKPVIRTINVAEGTVDRELSVALWTLFSALAAHTRCVVHKISWQAKVVGYPSDLDYLELLFTSLQIQMVDMMDPRPSVALTRAENIFNMKQAGRKWESIHYALQAIGQQKYDGTYEAKKGSTYIREYKKLCAERGVDPIGIAPQVWKRSFISSYSQTVKSRLATMAAKRDEENTGSSALALVDRRQQVLNWMYDEGLRERPHPRGCDCDRCHFVRCTDRACKRPRCAEYWKNSNKPVRDSRSYTYDERAMAAGAAAGARADLSGGRNNVGGRRGQLS